MKPRSFLVVGWPLGGSFVVGPDGSLSARCSIAPWMPPRHPRFGCVVPGVKTTVVYE